MGYGVVPDTLKSIRVLAVPCDFNVDVEWLEVVPPQIPAGVTKDARITAHETIRSVFLTTHGIPRTLSPQNALFPVKHTSVTTV